MVDVNGLASWITNYLKSGDFPEDTSINGLQVHASDEVGTVGLAVDASMETFQKMKTHECNFAVVHHGMYWKGVEPLIVGPTSNRVRFLLENKISLYASHLPLDAHPQVGNNVEIIKALGFRPKKQVDRFRWVCHPRKTIDEILLRVNEKIGAPIRQLKFGDESVDTLTVSSGGSTNAIFTAPEGSTVLIGELAHYGYHFAKERRINVIAAGHYATEKFGVIALGRVLEKKFKLPSIFVDVPTNI